MKPRTFPEAAPSTESKKLYTVTITAEVVVVAESAEAAKEAAEDARHAGDVEDFDFNAQPLRYLPGSWDGDCIPFGEPDKDDPDRDIEGWINAGAAPEYKRRAT